MSGRGRGRGKGRGRGRGILANPGRLGVLKRPGRSTSGARDGRATRPGDDNEQATPAARDQKPPSAEKGADSSTSGARIQQAPPQGLQSKRTGDGTSTSVTRIEQTTTRGESTRGAVGSICGAKAFKQPTPHLGGPQLGRDFDFGANSKAERTSASAGLTSSSDSILTATTPATLSLSPPIPISTTKEIDAKRSQPVSDQKSTCRDITIPESIHSQSKGDLPLISDSTYHSRSVDKNTSPCDSEAYNRELNKAKVHTLQTRDNKDSLLLHDPMTGTSVDTSLEPTYKAMTCCHDKLVIALSTDIISMSGVLFAKEFIPADISNKMLLPNLIPQEKATILVNAITDRIKIAPKRFNDLIKLFSEHTCTKDIVNTLLFHVRHEQDHEDDTQDCDAELNFSNQQHSVCEDRMYTAWVSLNPDDKLDLEARLIDDAEAIGEEFALLCWRVRDSFEQRDIKPQTLASALLDLTINEDLSNENGGISLLKKKEKALMSAKSVHDIFHVLRPHMNFFNYEILQFLIKGKGSKDDKMALGKFLKKFEEFCKRHVFEVPFTVYSNGQNSDNPIAQQRLHVKITRHFRAALLTLGASKSVPTANDSTLVDKICSSKLGINLEDAKNVQRKLAKILKLKPSSLFLDCISEGSVILTFLLPKCVSLAGLDYNPEIALLSSNGVIILCGPPGKPELKELTPNSIIVGWSKPEYGCDSLVQYQLYYQKKHELETSQWQKFELGSLETHTCVPDLSDGDTYVFKICAVSDVGTLQYSDESDPVIISANRILTNESHIDVVAKKEILTTAISSADPNQIAFQLSSSSKVIGPANVYGKKQPPDRPDVGTKGRRIMVRANFFPVELSHAFAVYQYDVSITPKLPKQINQLVYEQLVKEHFQGQRGAYDGSKSLYCLMPLKFQGEKLTISTQVELPNEDPTKPKKVTVAIKLASHVYVDRSGFQDIFQDASQRMSVIQALDVAFRHMPSLQMEPIGRSFFSQPTHPFPLGQGREVWSGHYQSLRPTSQWKLMLNVDVASKAFYTEQSVIDFMCAVLKDNQRGMTYEITDEDRHNYTHRPLHDADRARFAKEIKGVKIEVTHLPYPRKYKVHDVTRKSASDQTFPLDDGTQSTVKDYFATKHKIQLQYPHLPCLHVGSPQRNVFIPLELCKIVGGQRCVKKLTDIERAKMIRHTAQPAVVREKKIDDIIRSAKFGEDPLVKEFGVTVSSEMVSVPARVLKPPSLLYDDNRILNPQEKQGSWNMKDYKFYEGAEVNTWAVVNCSRYCRDDELKRFTSELERKCRAMGMLVKSMPIIDKQCRGETVEEMMKRLCDNIPSLNLVVAVIDKGSSSYYEIKQVGDTNGELAVATQCVLSETVQKKCNPSTLANICLKINAKLGGINNIIASDTLPKLLQEEPVIIFGADVTHPKSGDTTTPSIASVVASVDHTASKFRAKHHAQKNRQVVIAQLKEMVRELLLDFYRETNKTKPTRIIFYRDGVSKGEFEQICYEEVAAIQQACLSLQEDYQPGITFIMVQKHHHTRLFPTRPEDAIGKGGNVPPGTTVDTEITHPFEFDFYLSTHAATSRPCHFHVLWDDNDFTADDLQLLSYQLCHTFWRCNRSVSYPAPAYYAHRDAAHAKTLMQAQERSGSDSASVSSSSTRSEADIDRAITIHKDRKDRMYFL